MVTPVGGFERAASVMRLETATARADVADAQPLRGVMPWLVPRGHPADQPHRRLVGPRGSASPGQIR